MYAIAGGPAVAALAAAALVLLPGAAAADVTVAASRAESGARDVTITFRVTNDDPAVATTGLEVFLPTARPLLGVAPVAPTGWTARVGTAAPTTPVTVDGAPVPEIATSVAWEGGTLTGDGYAVFPVDVDRLPDGAGPLRFRVIQTFADGTTVEWSDLVPYGAPAPQHPALVVPYSDTPAAPHAEVVGAPPRRPGPRRPRRDGVAVVDDRARRRPRCPGRGGVGRAGTPAAAALRRPQRVPRSAPQRSEALTAGGTAARRRPRTGRVQPGQPARSSTVSVPVLRLLT